MGAECFKGAIINLFRADVLFACNRSRAYAFAAFAAFTMISATDFGCET